MWSMGSMIVIEKDARREKGWILAYEPKHILSLPNMGLLVCHPMYSYQGRFYETSIK